MSDFYQLQQQVQLATEEEREGDAIAKLNAFLDGQGRAPDRGAETWLRRTLGLLLRDAGRIDESFEHLQRAHELEPRDPDVGVAYGELLFRMDRGNEAVRVMRGLLIHHKESLDPVVVSSIYRHLGDHFLDDGELKQARAAFDNAVRLDPHNRQALDGMVRTIAELPPDEAIRSRRVLLSRLTDPADKAFVLLRQAEDVLERDGDTADALRLCEEALELKPGWIDALERKVSLSRLSGDVAEVADALFQLAQSSEVEEPAKRLEYLQQAYQTLKAEGADPTRLVKLLDAMLDLRPQELGWFEELTSLCADREQWPQLSRAYKGMIRRVREHGGSDNARLLPMLWRNLGELYATHLGKPEEGVRAMAVASQLAPKDIGVRLRIVELARGRDDVLDEAYQAVNELLALRPDDPTVRRERAQLAVLTGHFDAALVTLRVLKADGQWSDAYDAVYQRLHRPKLRLPTEVLSNKARRKRLRPKAQSYVLDSLLAIAGVVFHRLFEHDLGFYGLSEKQRVDLDESLVFNTVYSATAHVLGLAPPPQLYLKRKASGLRNAALDRPALIVGGDLMSGKSRREIAFICAQSLCLVRPEYALATIHDASLLKLIVVVLTHHVERSVPLPDSKAAARLKRELDRRLSPELEKHLRETVSSLVRDNLDVNVDAWVESIADEAMFTGLLLCNDLDVARAQVKNETGVKGVVADDERLRRLTRWALSDHHLKLREELGLALEAAG